MNVADAIDRMLAIDLARQSVRGARADYRAATLERCGFCYFWMKKECKPEKKHGQLKASDDLPCEDFNRDPGHAQWIEQKKSELAEAEANYTAITGREFP